MWNAQCSAQSRRVIIRGEGVTLRGYVKQGRLEGDALRVLRSLSIPRLLSTVIERTWKARYPEVNGEHAQKRLELYNGRGLRLVLAFSGNVPKSLLDGLNGLFRLPGSGSQPLPATGDDDAEIGEGRSERVPGGQVEQGQGHHAERGAAPEGLDGRGVQAEGQVSQPRSRRRRRRSMRS